VVHRETSNSWAEKRRRWFQALVVVSCGRDWSADDAD